MFGCIIPEEIYTGIMMISNFKKTLPNLIMYFYVLIWWYLFLSKNHTHLDSCPTCSEYWDFGLHEQAIFDYSAVIDYLLNNTQSSQLDFIGYSMGTTQVT